MSVDTALQEHALSCLLERLIGGGTAAELRPDQCEISKTYMVADIWQLEQAILTHANWNEYDDVARHSSRMDNRDCGEDADSLCPELD